MTVPLGQTDDAIWWPTPPSNGPIDATVMVPGSKSETNRALLLAAVADGPGWIHGALNSRDTRLMVRGLRALGAGVTIDETTSDLFVAPIDEVRTGATIDCGLAGTVLRFLPPLAALGDGPTTFTGDEAARVRPVRPVLDALVSMGAHVEYLAEPGFLPFTVTGPLSPRVDPADGHAHLSVDASASSQFLSALLLTAPLLGVPVMISAPGRLVSLPHVHMSVEALSERGVLVAADEDATPPTWTITPSRPHGIDTTIEPDLSNAGPFLAAALVCGGRVRIPGWPHTTTQAGDAWRRLLAAMGARVDLDRASLSVTGDGPASLCGIDADLCDVGELTPTLAALCALAPTSSHLSGVAHLRGHETDRLAALATELTRVGSDVEELPDGLVIRPSELRAARLHTYADHRMATFAAVLGLAIPGIEVEDIATTAKTLPNFPSLWHDMVDSGASR